MSVDMRRFLERHGLKWQDIMYILREDGLTIIYPVRGGEIRTYNTIKSLLEVLPDNEFFVINKGIVVSQSFVKSIDKQDCVMDDGAIFKMRVREADSIVKAVVERKKRQEAVRNMMNAGLALEQYAVFDDMPIALCVIELVFDKDGHGMDFVFRYCNKMMGVLEDMPAEDMVNRSLYEVLPDGDRKWLVTYADVAMNGNNRVIQGSYSPKLDKLLSVYCFRPKKNFCACAILPPTVQYK